MEGYFILHNVSIKREKNLVKTQQTSQFVCDFSKLPSI